jgi:hypothetical protein
VRPNSSVIISQSAAARLWPNQDPIGQRVRRASGAVQWFTVVGLVQDVKQDDWRTAGEAIVYFPLTGPTPNAWAMGSPAYVVKSPRASSLGREVRELVRQVAPEAPVYRELYDGVSGAAIHGAAVLYDADARRGLGARDDPGSRRAVRLRAFSTRCSTT